MPGLAPDQHPRKNTISLVVSCPVNFRYPVSDVRGGLIIFRGTTLSSAHCQGCLAMSRPSHLLSYHHHFIDWTLVNHLHYHFHWYSDSNLCHLSCVHIYCEQLCDLCCGLAKWSYSSNKAAMIPAVSTPTHTRCSTVHCGSALIITSTYYLSRYYLSM